MVRDAYGRPLATLRVVLTERCNFNCIFCHREGIDGTRGELSTRDHLLIAKATSILGIKYVKFTGGEPLLRRDLEEIVRGYKLAGFEDISLTTNGFLLEEKIEGLKVAGLRWVNVSLHSLKRDRFKSITGVDALEKVLRGIEKALEFGVETRINVVVMKGVNEDEILDIIKYAVERGISVHLIELHPVGKGTEVYSSFHDSDRMKAIKQWLERVASKKEVRELHNRPRYYIGDAFVELVMPVGNPHFCAGCSRLRLSPDGRFYPCLNISNIYFDASTILKCNCSENEKLKKLVEGILYLNDLRRPYYMWNMDYEKKMNYTGVTKINRLEMPKRAKLQFYVPGVTEGGNGEEKLRYSPLRV